MFISHWLNCLLTKASSSSIFFQTSCGRFEFWECIDKNVIVYSWVNQVNSFLSWTWTVRFVDHHPALLRMMLVLYIPLYLSLFSLWLSNYLFFSLSLSLFYSFFDLPVSFSLFLFFSLSFLTFFFFPLFSSFSPTGPRTNSNLCNIFCLNKKILFMNNFGCCRI